MIYQYMASPYSSYYMAPVTPRSEKGKAARRQHLKNMASIMTEKHLRRLTHTPRTHNNRKKREANMMKELETYSSQSIQKPVNLNAQNSNAQNSNAQSETVCNERGCWARFTKRIGWSGGRKTRRTRKTRTR
jgi:hypothetical protein